MPSADSHGPGEVSVNELDQCFLPCGSCACLMRRGPKQGNNKSSASLLTRLVLCWGTDMMHASVMYRKSLHIVISSMSV